MKALLLLHSGQLVFFPCSNILKNSREISVEFNDLEYVKKKLIVSFFQVTNTNPDLDLNLQDAIRVISASRAWGKLSLFLSNYLLYVHLKKRLNVITT